MDNTLITVIMPTYNRRHLLGDAVRYIVNQTFRQWRLLIINDGGEPVGDIAESFQDSRIEYYDREHAGKSAALNFGLSLVRSKYIAYSDDDDELYPEHLQVLYDAAESSQCGFVFSDTLITVLNPQGEVVSQRPENMDDVSAEDLRFANRINHKNILHTKELADKTGSYDTTLRIWIDYDYIKRLAALSEPRHVRRITGNHIMRQSDASGSLNSISGLWGGDLDAVGRSMLAIFGKNPEDIAHFYRHYGEQQHQLYLALEKQNSLTSELENDRNNPFREIKGCIKNKLKRWKMKLKSCIKEWIKKTGNPHFIAFCKRIYLHFQKSEDFGVVFRKVQGNPASQKKISGGPLVSILTCVWNTKPDFLREMLDSVLAQTYQNWELCLNNTSDAGHAEVGEILREYASGDKRIRIIEGENRGISENSKAVAEIATGEFLLLMDHDDFLTPYAIAKLMKKQQACNADFVYADEYYYFVEYNLTKWTVKKPFSTEALWHDNFINHPALFRKSLFEKAGGFRAGYDGSQDHELYFRLTESAGNISYIPEPLYFWRMNGGSFSQQHIEKCIQSGKRALEEHLARIHVDAEVIVNSTDAVYNVRMKNK